MLMGAWVPISATGAPFFHLCSGCQSTPALIAEYYNPNPPLLAEVSCSFSTWAGIIFFLFNLDISLETKGAEEPCKVKSFCAAEFRISNTKVQGDERITRCCR